MKLVLNIINLTNRKDLKDGIIINKRIIYNNIDSKLVRILLEKHCRLCLESIGLNKKICTIRRITKAKLSY
jgi:hypothetical protein